MPGDNCSVYGCGTSRRTPGVGIFKIPSSKEDEWRKRFINQVTKTRVIDSQFRSMIENDRVFACERHFEADDVEICKHVHYIYYNLKKFNLTDDFSVSVSQRLFKNWNTNY